MERGRAGRGRMADDPARGADPELFELGGLTLTPEIAAIWVPSSAARSVFKAVRSPGHTAVSSNWMCSRAAPVNAASSVSNSASPASSLSSLASTSLASCSWPVARSASVPPSGR